jgi:hypothetical protein
MTKRVVIAPGEAMRKANLIFCLIHRSPEP